MSDAGGGPSTVTADSGVETLQERVQQVAQEYSGGEDRPLGGYAALLGTYATTVAAGALIGRFLGVRLPERLSWDDLALVTVAAHKLARTLTKDAITSPIRAPFTEYAAPAGEGELHEEVRGGTGLRHAVGELLTCPFCASQWVSTGFLTGLVVAPRQARFAASLFAVVAGSDWLQLAYAALQQAAKGD